MISGNFRKYTLYMKSVEEWKIILALADRFCFAEVKNLCVRELQKKSSTELSLVDRVALYTEFDVDSSHLIPLYAGLCERDTPLTLVEAKILGIEATVFIANTREELRAKPSDEGRSPLPDGMRTEDVFRMIEKKFRFREGSQT